MNDRIFVSVIIPTYNRADRIVASVNSVLQQTHDALEVVVIDDGSTDDTEACIADIHDSRLRYHHMKKNGGVSNARNFGVALAQFDTIAFHDSDDLWRPYKLEKQLEYWHAHPEDILIYSGFDYVNERTGESGYSPSGDVTLDELCGMIYPLLLIRNTIGAPTIMMKKDIFQRVYGFNSSYPTLEDWDFALKVARIGSIGYVDEALLDVSIHDSGISSSISNYFDARCRLLGDYLQDIREYGLFDQIAGEILSLAERFHLVNSVKQSMMKELQSHIEHTTNLL